MAKKSEYESIKKVTCEGCIYSEPIDGLKGHCFCGHRAVKMIHVIETIKPCVWKQYGKEND